LHETEDISHRDISRELVDAMILYPVNAKQRKNDFLKSGTKTSSHSERRRALSVRKLANVAKCSYSTVSRHLNRLEESGIIQTIRHEEIPVFDLDRKIALTDDRFLLSRGRYQSTKFLVVRDANEYRITRDEDIHMATNVIFNHRKRHRENEVYSPIACFEH
jgi:DNA-binding transcriptional regulator YhcF (GntR family)